MKHLRLLGMESEREALLKAMQDMECVEISSIDGSEEALKSGFAKPDDKALMSAQEASRAYRTALASLDRFAPEKKGMFRKRQGVSRATFFSAESEENARTAAETINKDTRRLGEIESERTKNEALRATLAPWLTVDAPLGGADGALAVFFGTVGLNVTDDALKALADSLDGLLTWQQASSDRSLRYLLVMCHGSVKERALSALRDLGFSTVSFRGMTGTAKENDKALAENLAALEKERQEIEQRIAGLGGKREALLEASDRAPSRCGARRRRADLSARIRSSYWKAGCPPTAARRSRKRSSRLPARSKRASRQRTSTRRCRCSSKTTS